MEMVYDENGYPEKEVEKANLTFKYSKSGFSVEGSVKMTSETTYTFK